MLRPIRIALKAVAIYAAVSLTVAIVMAEMTLHPWRRPLPDQNKERIARIYAQYSAKLQPLTIKATDGVELHAWYSVPAHDNGNAVILLHGIGDNRLGVAGYGHMFLQQGYRVLLPDSRAHGESGGQIATYGLRESDDVHRWVSWLYERGATCVDGFGESMGHLVTIPAFTPSPFVDILARVRKNKTRAVALLNCLPPTLGFAKNGAPPVKKTAELRSAGQVRHLPLRAPRP
jgi:pimeloyl-ACP methyl ester carboxylesterase